MLNGLVDLGCAYAVGTFPMIFPRLPFAR